MAKKQSKPTTPPAPVVAPSLQPAASKPQVVETLVVSIEADAEIISQVPTLATRCKWLKFTSSDKCRSMEAWQILFEQNGFVFVRDLGEPTIRTQLYQSLMQ